VDAQSLGGSGLSGMQCYPRVDSADLQMLARVPRHDPTLSLLAEGFPL
jgi:hypothetical protein